ncbi:hypothetical protein CANARDRAFT_26224 [[Candida] arabinofermentans NRRL YB-2248]|uniref:Mitochondrial escape protein 2 n=1 Tax=[Candida] arabinofermentans NRRL YB-2248 TaxID=983967 RepID=A0A1E4T8J2_9ASCO|nr:hypothetical protein CANARDRAFT_26224 [[Candida] arabinofermentans NRRL YB-2248]
MTRLFNNMNKISLQFAKRACIIPGQLRGQLNPGVIRQSARFITEEAILKETGAGEDDDVSNTGVILKERRESLLFFDHITPFKSNKYDIAYFMAPLLYDMSASGSKARVLELSQAVDENDKLPLEITSFTPLPRDGSAFAKFKVPDGMDIQDFNKRVIQNLKDKQGKGIFSYLFHPRCFAVKGVPWIEDLRRYPSAKLKITYEGPDLSQENLYLLFRRYGSINDIVPPAPDSKDNPRSARIFYRSLRSAIAARHCITGTTVGATTIHVQYESVIKVNMISDFIGKHSRIAIPLLFAALAGIAVLIFDPIRQFFIYEKITSAYSLQKSYYYQQLVLLLGSTKQKMSQMFFNERKEENVSILSMWTERQDKVKEIKLWIEENVNSFIVVQGPRGSGKRNLIQDHVLQGRENCLYIDCDNIIKARKEREFLSSFADEIGYYPVFSWLSSVSSFVDLIAQGLTGQKSGLSESKEAQVSNILSLASNVVRDIALSKYHSLSADDPRSNLKEEDYLQQNPDDKPVIVIDRYQATRKANNPNSFMYQEIADWAANLIALNIAHVIFITDDVGSLQVLSKALPSPPFKRSTLSDASESSSANYILSQLENEEATRRWVQDEKSQLELFEAIRPFGGRMLDLQMFVRRVKGGETPQEALTGIVTQSIEQLGQIFISQSSATDSAQQRSGPTGFSASQAWLVIKALAEKDFVAYQDLFGNPLFKTETFKALAAMENAELITIIREKGLIKKVIPAKPIYRTAFKTMVNDKNLFISLEADHLTYLVKFETGRIAKWEDELSKFRAIGDTKIFKERLQYLAGKIDGSTKTISESEKKLAQLLKG